MSTSKSVTARAAALKSRVITVEASISKTPDPTIDFMQSFKNSSGLKTDSSNEFVIDLYPDPTATVCYITSTMAKYQHDIDKLSCAKTSLPSSTAYCIYMYYAYFLAHDAFVRPGPSAHAIPWLNDHTRINLLDKLLSLPVPEFMITIFDQLAATESNSRKNIHIVPSLAGYSYSQFHGKIIPPMFYINVHNTICDLVATAKLDMLLNLLERPIYKIKNINDATTPIPYVFTALDFLGGTITASGTGTTQTHHVDFLNTKWYQYYDKVFNPVLARTYQRREHLAEIPLTAPTFASRSKTNIYDLIFSPSKNNAVELTAVLDMLSGTMKGIVPFTKTLAEVISSSAGSSAFKHGYSHYSLPLMTHDRSPLPAKLSKVNKIDPADFATSIKFLGIPPKQTGATVLKQPIVQKNATGTDAAVPSPRGYSIKDLFTRALFRQHEADSTSDFPPNDHFQSFDEDDHLYSKVLVFDPSQDAEISGYLTVLSGKVIETLDIDGTTVGHPNLKTPLGVENSLFFDSAIPFNMVYRRSHFSKDNTDQLRAVALKRAPTIRQTRHPASTILVDRTTMLLPQYEPTMNDIAGSGAFAGLTQQTNVTWFQHSLRFIGFHSPDFNSNDYPTIPGLPASKRLLVWSPYTFTAAEDEDFSDDFDPSLTRRFFITNLRTIFGTDVPLVQSKSALAALPV